MGVGIEAQISNRSLQAGVEHAPSVGAQELQVVERYLSPGGRQCPDFGTSWFCVKWIGV